MVEPLFRKVQLGTGEIELQREFYASSLGLPLCTDWPDRFSVRAGATELEFVDVGPGVRPRHHIAFNIPENQIHEALDWIRRRATVAARGDGAEIYHFESWNAQAFYFFDPAGNLLEFIARHSLPNTARSPFCATSIPNISEVGVATADVAATSREVEGCLGLPCYPDPEADPGSDFQALGDANGLFVIARTGRTWLGSDLSAEASPVRVWTTTGIQLQLTDTYVEIC